MKIDKNLQPITTDRTSRLKAHRDYLLNLLQEHQERFAEMLEECRIEKPSLYMRVMMELNKLVVPKENNVNVAVTLDRDFMELEALASTGHVSHNGIDELVEYEEIGAEPFESNLLPEAKKAYYEDNGNSSESVE